MDANAHFVAAVMFCVAAPAFAAEEARTFKDPAPPKVATAQSMSAPTARDNPDATFHGAPKPLPKGAVTSDWPSFLGPTHNMFSPETKLLKEFPREGLKP